MQTPSDPTEEELCRSLRLLKVKLPHRSMEQILKEVYKVILQRKTPSTVEVHHEADSHAVKREESDQTPLLSKNYKAKDRKLEFPSQEQQARYLHYQIAAKAFIKRGYGLHECRKQFAEAGVQLELNGDKFKNLTAAVVTLAIRFHEEYIAKECKRVFKPLDRQCIRANLTMFLNARHTLTADNCEVFFRMIKASLALEDVTISHFEAYQLYEGWMKQIYGQSITLEHLERIGKIDAQRNQERMQKYQTLKETKPRKSGRPKLNQQQSRQMRRKRIERQLQFSEELRTQGKSTLENNPHLRVKLEFDQFWRPDRDVELINYYISHKDVNKCTEKMRDRYPCFLNSLTYLQVKNRLIKLLKRSIKRIQVQSQSTSQSMSQSMPQLAPLHRLNRLQMLFIIKNPKAEFLRENLLKYYVREESQSQQLRQIIMEVEKTIDNVGDQAAHQQNEEMYSQIETAIDQIELPAVFDDEFLGLI